MYLVFDIGGTKIRLAVSEDGDKISQAQIIPTPTDFNEAMVTFQKTVDQLTHGKQIKASAGGVRALDVNKKKLAYRPRLSLWVGEPLYDRLQSIVNAPLFLENDADMAGLGEAAVGAGQGHKIVAYMTISTGTGGSRIVNGKIDTNTIGFEPGYQIIHNEKVLGDYVSGRALETLTGQRPEDIKDPQVWDSVARYLAVGLNNIVVFWSPDIIVLGGSVTNSIPLDKVRGYLKELLKIFPDQPEIVQAKLGDSAGLYGALVLLGD